MEADRSETIARRLSTTSSQFARSAVAAYVAESWEVFYVHLATGLELLLKAVLANLHPVLIADPKLIFDTLLHLTGLGGFATTPESAVRTIAVSEALKRVPHVVAGYVPVSARVQFVLDTRNGIVHFGQGARTEHEAVLGDVARYVGPLLTALKLSPEEYWGDSTELVDEHARRQLDALEAAYTRKVEAARERYARFLEPLEDADREALVTRLERTDMSDDFAAWPATCPACEHQGTIHGWPEPDWEVDWDYSDGQAWAAGQYVDKLRLHVNAFDCRVCRLSLDSTFCDLAGFGVVTITDADHDLGDATMYFTQAAAEDDWDR